MYVMYGSHVSVRLLIAVLFTQDEKHWRPLEAEPADLSISAELLSPLSCPTPLK